MTGDLDHILVKGTSHEVKVTEEEGLLDVKADGQDIGGIASSEFLHLLEAEHLLSKDHLLIICHHDDQGDIENILKPPRDHIMLAGAVLASNGTGTKEEKKTKAVSTGKSHLVKVKGTMCPRCMLSLLGPRPV